MPYRQYTECVAPEHYNDAPLRTAFVDGGFAGFTAFVTGTLLVALFSGAGSLALLATSASVMGIVVFGLSLVHWWLYGRLICLGGDRCVIGMVLSIEPPSGNFDTDYSFSILLPPLLPGAIRPE